MTLPEFIARSRGIMAEAVDDGLPGTYTIKKLKHAYNTFENLLRIIEIQAEALDLAVERLEFYARLDAFDPKRPKHPTIHVLSDIKKLLSQLEALIR